jgi:ubiquinone/menaquinone biosynthesis C-methylase UbiE
VASVTALDFSTAMLARLRERCAQEGLVNVRTVLGAWQDEPGTLR